MNAAQLTRNLRRNLSIVLCFAGSVVLFAAAAFRHSDVAAAGTSLQDGHDRLEKIRRNTMYATTLSDDLHRLEVYDSRVRTSVMNPSEKARNLAYLYGVGAKLGLVVSRADQSVIEPPAATTESAPKVVPELRSYSSMRLDVELEGDFASIIRFMDTVRAEHFFIRYETVMIHPSKDPTGRSLQAVLNISVLTEKTGGAR
ncbi:MAG TPA: hypothetical protein PKI32_05695 [Opitutales bacterium]|nr:hypothetical protein [Opitutales bacterium]